ncbi:excalibur calcium-binding domain-containing protein [Paenibacillus kobensis]|uniref:excalibur calcium-binding domain-containing protein n=1 Tax=Paenibacillus kobensis TaxID=59841 RepID=UPI001FE797E7|nr:excalibur calcium-binding domain-containing protein [Paenibacillus kobensis]
MLIVVEGADGPSEAGTSATAESAKQQSVQPDQDSITEDSININTSPDANADSSGSSSSGSSIGPAQPDITYRNCTAVREAGAAPLHRDDPGYSQKLDRDGDGVACE